MKREETQQFNVGPYVSYIWSIAHDWLRDVYVPFTYPGGIDGFFEKEVKNERR